ncbi:hypothetical protein DKM19_45640 [Streptosporangium sp. 'caverna']|nr:hypothetical protein DKM19_45640 [Streptosporangium sp. 'caverna']
MSAPLWSSHDRVKAGAPERSLTAAIEVLAEQGFADATADEIAFGAGHTADAVFSSFLGKNDHFPTLFALTCLDKDAAHHLDNTRGIALRWERGRDALRGIRPAASRRGRSSHGVLCHIEPTQNGLSTLRPGSIGIARSIDRPSTDFPYGGRPPGFRVPHLIRSGDRP